MKAKERVCGKRVVVLFESERCIHSRHCVLDRPDIFVPIVAGAWVFPDRATPEGGAALAQSCPSGGIGFVRFDGGPEEAAPHVNVISVRENGPLALHAEVNIAGDGRVFRATRCRCGASQRTPFCDSAHVTASFRSTGEPVAAESQPLPERAGLVKLIPLPNGPLLLNSNEEICTGTGNTLNSTTKTALCRCGQSANKLYCDGTHVRVGFTAEWR